MDKKIEKAFYAEREYLKYSYNKNRIKTIYYWIKWKILESSCK